jgi:ubiquinone/menaquinone biosynthesis C-methylase UbiE
MMTTETRKHVHGMWNAVAPHWATHADYVDAKAATLTKTMLDAASVGATDRVLELACGAAGLGVAAAAVADAVVVSDVAEAMVAVAQERTSGLANVTAKVLDVEEIAEPDASFDVVLCREGLMFATDAQAALHEVRRVLRPGGRLAAAVWGPQEDNPWLGLVLDAVSAQLGRPMPPPGMPGPFSLSDATELLALARVAGFERCDIARHDVPTVAASFEDWWARTSALAGPLANVLPMLPDDAKAELESRLRTSTAAYASADGSLAFPGMSLLLTASV